MLVRLQRDKREAGRVVDVQTAGQTSAQHSHCKRRGKLRAQLLGSVWALAADALLPQRSPLVTAPPCSECLTHRKLLTMSLAPNSEHYRNCNLEKTPHPKGPPKVGVLMSAVGLIYP